MLLHIFTFDLKNYTGIFISLLLFINLYILVYDYTPLYSINQILFIEHLSVVLVLYQFFELPNSFFYLH